MKHILLALAFICIAGTSYAAEKLTKENIQEFYDDSISAQLDGQESAMTFFEKHVHEDSKVVLNIITNMKGAPPQKQTINHDKKSLLKDTRIGYETSKLEKVESSVLSAEISEDGKVAKVKDTTYGVSIINIPSAWGTKAFRAEQSMLCDGQVVLEGGIIQSKDSTCNVEVTMTPVK